MDSALKVQLLGTLEACINGTRTALGGPRQRTVFARLVISADRIVSIDALVDEVWSGRPPATARTQVAICVSALRRAFQSAGLTEEVIVTAHPGYMFRAGTGTIDAAEFISAHDRGRGAARTGDLAEAVACYRQALDLWRGEPLTGVTGPQIEAEAADLADRRLIALEELAALRLDLGDHRALIGELAAVVNEHPLREQARMQLMLAQYRSGRRAEALETFRNGRQVFVGELGLEPGPLLQDLHDAILADDPVLLPQSPTPAVAPDTVSPVPLPPNVPMFTGRDAELAVLDELAVPRGRTEPPRVGFVTGPGGAGKSGLALRWAHRVVDAFPDGQLVADLGGCGTEPACPADVLHRFLRALGTPAHEIPADPHERAALYRARLDGRQMLVLLDNARSFDQIRDLIPGNGGCGLLVTSRNSLDEMAAGLGAVRVRLGPLELSDAVRLLSDIVDGERISADPAGTARLAELCDRLPRVLRLAAGRLASKPHWSVQHLVARIEDEARRFDVLSHGGYELRSEFAASYRTLPAQAARAYRWLALLEVPDFAAWTGAAVLDTTVADAESVLESLVDRNVLEVVPQPCPNEIRYRLSGLHRLYGREVSRSTDPEPVRQAVLHRAFDTGATLDALPGRQEAALTAA